MFSSMQWFFRIIEWKYDIYGMSLYDENGNTYDNSNFGTDN